MNCSSDISDRSLKLKRNITNQFFLRTKRFRKSRKVSFKIKKKSYETYTVSDRFDSCQRKIFFNNNF